MPMHICALFSLTRHSVEERFYRANFATHISRKEIVAIHSVFYIPIFLAKPDEFFTVMPIKKSHVCNLDYA